MIVISSWKAESALTNGLHNPARRLQFHELHVDHVLPVGRLSAGGVLVRWVEKRHSISATGPCVERMDLAGHFCRRQPLDERAAGSMKAA
jgi:hypothetical protein